MTSQLHATTSDNTRGQPPGVEMKNDLLSVDDPIDGQNWQVFSYVAQEKVIQQFDMFAFEEFAKQWDFAKTAEIYSEFTSFLSFKLNVDADIIKRAFGEFLQDERAGLKEVSSNVYYDFKNFMDMNKAHLRKTFAEKVTVKMSCRGIKFRGAFETKELAHAHADACSNADGHKFNVHIVSMGHWMDLDTNTSKNKEYPNADLNRLMHEMDKNKKLADAEFGARKNEKISKAMKENIERAEKSGNKLTQYQDEDGNLVNSTIMDAITNVGAAGVTVDDIENALFNSDNIATRSEREQHYSTIKAKLGIVPDPKSSSSSAPEDEILPHETTVD